MHIEVIIIIIVIVRFILDFLVVFFSVSIDVIRFISLSILILPCNPYVSYHSKDCNNHVDKVIDETTSVKCHGTHGPLQQLNNYLGTTSHHTFMTMNRVRARVRVRVTRITSHVYSTARGPSNITCTVLQAVEFKVCH